MITYGNNCNAGTIHRRPQPVVMREDKPGARIYVDDVEVRDTFEAARICGVKVAALERALGEGKFGVNGHAVHIINWR